MTVDNKNIYFNPEYVKRLDKYELIGALAHEVMHVASGHPWRQGNRSHKRWNMATDYTINNHLLATGFTLPKDALTDSQYNNKAAEEIYNVLPADKDNDKENKPGADPGGCGGVMPPPPDTTHEQIEESKAEWTAATAQALSIDKEKGEAPADIKRMVDEAKNPTVPWYVLLRDFVERTARNDYDWQRPSARYAHRGVVLPSLVSEEIPEILIAIDTSGSIKQAELNHFAVEASQVLEAYNTKIRIVYCDTQVHEEAVDVYTRQDLPLNLKPIGGGGTDFRPVFEYVNKNCLMPSCLIYFTDLYGDFPDKQPDYPVMWLSTTEGKVAPFGFQVNFKVDNK